MKIFSVLLFFTASISLNAQNQQVQNLQDQYQLTITQALEKITVDGDLSESTWSEADATSDFWMSYPVDGKMTDSKMQTEVRMAFDDQFMYLGVICYGDEDYVIQTLKRDIDLPKGDGFGVVIDPVNEKTNGFAFGLNPVGVQTELLITGSTGRRGDEEPKGTNVAWDNKWFSEVKNYADRWTIEIAIPFKSLRYEEDKSVWGINFFRFDAKSK